MKKSEILKKIKEDLRFFTGPHNDLTYSSDYLVESETKILEDGRPINAPTGVEEFVITISLKRE